MLAHELQHAVEIANTPGLASEADLLSLYRRIGYPSWNDNSFETREAVVVQMMVARELEADPDHGAEAPAGQGSAGDAAQSRLLFTAYCTACHGGSGRGNGPAASAMTTRPPDLTVLARQRGGEFPWSRVEACIRAAGRRPPANVTAGMPVWRPVMTHRADVPAAHARDLAALLESLQR